MDAGVEVRVACCWCRDDARVRSEVQVEDPLAMVRTVRIHWLAGNEVHHSDTAGVCIASSAWEGKVVVRVERVREDVSRTADMWWPS